MNAYRQMTVVSGKGGTGKTSVTAAFAALAEGIVVADTDVDAANLHILLHPTLRHSEPFFGAHIAVRDEDRCTRCGECERRCRFGAITVEQVSAFACEGCGFCTLVCPENALRMEPALTGDLYISDTHYGPMAHAKLNPGGESSGKLVTMVRQAAENLALANGLETILVDGPPGIGCTATAAMADVDLALIVTEPTPSGIHDMVRVIGTAAHFHVPVAVIINKWDLNKDKAWETAEAAESNGAVVLGRLPYDETFTYAVAATQPVVEFAPASDAAKAVEVCWERVREYLCAV